MNQKIRRILDLLRKQRFRKIIYLMIYKVSTFTNKDKPAFPIYAILGSTNVCNLKCLMCPRRDPKLKEEMNSEMPFENFKKIIDQMPYLIGVTPEALGEPFLHKDIFKMVKYAKSKGIEVYIHSNGTIVNKEIAEKILDSGLDELYFSLDGATKKTYESIRIGANFDVVIKNIKNIVEMRNQIKNPMKISLKPVIMKENVGELPTFIELAKELGINDIEFGDIQYLYDMGYLATKEQALRTSKEKEEIEKIFEETRKKARQNNIRIILPDLKQNTVFTKCTYPWTTITITPQGLVRPCCGVHTIKLGNAFNESIKSIWNKSEFIAWRKAMKSQNPPSYCLKCPSF